MEAGGELSREQALVAVERRDVLLPHGEQRPDAAVPQDLGEVGEELDPGTVIVGRSGEQLLELIEDQQACLGAMSSDSGAVREVGAESDADQLLVGVDAALVLPFVCETGLQGVDGAVGVAVRAGRHTHQLGQLLADANRREDAEVVRVAKEIGRTPAQVALNWVLGGPGVIVPLVGARTREQLDDNLGCLAFELDAEQRSRLDDVSGIELGFPHDFLQEMTPRGIENHRA